MRKADREINIFQELVRIIKDCQVVRMGMYAENYPYIVPLSFGFHACDEKLTVYFHCASEGKKIDLLTTDNRVCLEWDILKGYAEINRSITADYESVIAFGKAYRCVGKERIDGLKFLLEHTGFEKYSAEACAALPIVDVWKVVCDKISGKHRFRSGI